MPNRPNFTHIQFTPHRDLVHSQVFLVQESLLGWGEVSERIFFSSSGASGRSIHGDASFKVEKDPAVPKILRDSELLRRSVSTTPPPIFTTM